MIYILICIFFGLLAGASLTMTLWVELTMSFRQAVGFGLALFFSIIAITLSRFLK
jgi:hypothetical protein